MLEDLSIMGDPDLTEKELRDLNLGDDLGYSGCYCQGCSRCLSQCHAGADVPTMMRAHMYAFSYGEPAKAREFLQLHGLSGIPCADCSSCEVECSLSLDVKGRGMELAGLRGVFTS
jgi:hypothetical protein